MHLQIEKIWPRFPAFSLRSFLPRRLLVSSNYKVEHTRSLPVFIYWGSAGAGYENRRRTELPAGIILRHPATGPESGPVPGDRRQQPHQGRRPQLRLLSLPARGKSPPGIRPSLHPGGLRCDSVTYSRYAPSSRLVGGRRNGLGARGTFTTDCYWGGEEGYSIQRRTHLPTAGTHFAHGIAPGNIYDRGPEYDYLSRVLPIPAERRFLVPEWRGETPHNTAIRMQLRFGSDQQPSTGAAWRETGRGECHSLDENSTALQYRAVLVSPDGGNSPVLEGVSLRFVDSCP